MAGSSNAPVVSSVIAGIVACKLFRYHCNYAQVQGPMLTCVLVRAHTHARDARTCVCTHMRTCVHVYLSICLQGRYCVSVVAVDLRIIIIMYVCVRACVRACVGGCVVLSVLISWTLS